MSVQVMPEHIVKISRPLSTTESYNNCLIYNEDRDIQFTQVFSNQDMAKIFPNSEVKAYMKANFDAISFSLGDHVEEQDW